MGYAVVDVETTGLDAAGGDRVIEIGVVQLDAHARPVREWSTLINPGRDVGATSIHGIRDFDVVGAPRFHQIAHHLAGLLRGRVIVAHNLPFDLSFLEQEYRAFGYSLCLDASDGVCTVQRAEQYLPGVSRALASCAAETGIPTGRAHAALDDARTAAALLQYYRAVDADGPWRELLQRATDWKGPQKTSRPGEVHDRAAGAAKVPLSYAN